MTKQEAREEATKLRQWEKKEKARLLEEAKKAGIRIVGLDGDSVLFKELNRTVKQRLLEINRLVDED